MLVRGVQLGEVDFLTELRQILLDGRSIDLQFVLDDNRVGVQSQRDVPVVTLILDVVGGHGIHHRATESTEKTKTRTEQPPYHSSSHPIPSSVFSVLSVALW